MRIGSLVDIPGRYSDFGIIEDQTTGDRFSVERGQFPNFEEDADSYAIGDQASYKVELWSGGGLGFDLDFDPD